MRRKRKYIDDEPKPWPVALQLLVFVAMLVGLFVLGILVSEAMLKGEILNEGIAWLPSYLACEAIIHREENGNEDQRVEERRYREDSTSLERPRHHKDYCRRKKST